MRLKILKIAFVVFFKKIKSKKFQEKFKNRRKKVKIEEIQRKNTPIS